MPPAVSARLPEGLRVLQLRSIYDHDLQVALCAHLAAHGVQGGGQLTHVFRGVLVGGVSVPSRCSQTGKRAVGEGLAHLCVTRWRAACCVPGAGETRCQEGQGSLLARLQ